MQDDMFFDRVHQALDIATPPGAYERLRNELIKKPALPLRWPAVNERWRKMGFRLAAGLAIVALVVAIAAALAATHNLTGVVSPAHQPRTAGDYQKLVLADFTTLAGTWPDPCDITHQAGCLANLNRSIPVEERFLQDLRSAPAPAEFAVFDAELQHHLDQDIPASKALRAAIQAHDDAAFNREMIVGVYAGEWSNTVMQPGFQFARQVDQATYVSSVSTQIHALQGCTACQQLLSVRPGQCVFSAPGSCLDLFDGMGVTLAKFEGALLQFGAPAALAAKDLKLQKDLEQADEVMISMRAAWGTGDPSAFFAGVTALAPIVSQIEQDASAITG